MTPSRKLRRPPGASSPGKAFAGTLKTCLRSFKGIAEDPVNPTVLGHHDEVEMAAVVEYRSRMS